VFYISQLLDQSGPSPELISIIRNFDWKILLLRARICESLANIHQRLIVEGHHATYTCNFSQEDSNDFEFSALSAKMKQASQDYLEVSLSCLYAVAGLIFVVSSASKMCSPEVIFQSRLETYHHLYP